MKRTITVIGMCVTMMLMGAYVRADAPHSRCARIGQKWVDFWNAKSADKATALFPDVFTDDIVYNDIPTNPTTPVAEGRDQLLAFASGFFDTFPNSSFALGQSACQVQQGFFEWTWTAVDKPGFFGTDKSFTVRGVAVIAIQGERISRNSDFWDLATVMGQLDCDTFPSCHKIP
jgi:steroid delta-isomerase-like uncharacterized protein